MKDQHSQPTQPSLSEIRSLYQILLDAHLSSSKLEGSTDWDVLNAVIKICKTHPSLPHLKDLLHKLQGDSQVLAQAERLHIIQTLKKQKQVFFPAGWLCKNDRNHCIYFQIKKEKVYYSIKIFNRGNGISYYKNYTNKREKKYSSAYLELKKCIDLDNERFLEKLIDAILAPMKKTFDHVPLSDGEAYYYYIFAQIQLFIPEKFFSYSSSSNLIQYSDQLLKPQVSDTCTWKSFSATLSTLLETTPSAEVITSIKIGALHLLKEHMHANPLIESVPIMLKLAIESVSTRLIKPRYQESPHLSIWQSELKKLFRTLEVATLAPTPKNPGIALKSSDCKLKYNPSKHEVLRDILNECSDFTKCNKNTQARKLPPSPWKLEDAFKLSHVKPVFHVYSLIVAIDTLCSHLINELEKCSKSPDSHRKKSDFLLQFTEKLHFNYSRGITNNTKNPFHHHIIDYSSFLFSCLSVAAKIIQHKPSGIRVVIPGREYHVFSFYMAIFTKYLPHLSSLTAIEQTSYWDTSLINIQKMLRKIPSLLPMDPSIVFTEALTPYVHDKSNLQFETLKSNRSNCKDEFKDMFGEEYLLFSEIHEKLTQNMDEVKNCIQNKNGKQLNPEQQEKLLLLQKKVAIIYTLYDTSSSITPPKNTQEKKFLNPKGHVKLLGQLDFQKISSLWTDLNSPQNDSLSSNQALCGIDVVYAPSHQKAAQSLRLAASLNAPSGIIQLTHLIRHSNILFSIKTWMPYCNTLADLTMRQRFVWASIIFHGQLRHMHQEIFLQHLLELAEALNQKSIQHFQDQKITHVTFLIHGLCLLVDAIEHLPANQQNHHYAHDILEQALNMLSRIHRNLSPTTPAEIYSLSFILAARCLHQIHIHHFKHPDKPALMTGQALTQLYIHYLTVAIGHNYPRYAVSDLYMDNALKQYLDRAIHFVQLSIYYLFKNNLLTVERISQGDLKHLINHLYLPEDMENLSCCDFDGVSWMNWEYCATNKHQLKLSVLGDVLSNCAMPTIIPTNIRHSQKFINLFSNPEKIHSIVFISGHLQFIYGKNTFQIDIESNDYFYCCPDSEQHYSYIPPKISYKNLTQPNFFYDNKTFWYCAEPKNNEQWLIMSSPPEKVPHLKVETKSGSKHFNYWQQYIIKYRRQNIICNNEWESQESHWLLGRLTYTNCKHSAILVEEQENKLTHFALNLELSFTQEKHKNAPIYSDQFKGYQVLPHPDIMRFFAPTMFNLYLDLQATNRQPLIIAPICAPISDDTTHELQRYKAIKPSYTAFDLTSKEPRYYVYKWNEELQLCMHEDINALWYMVYILTVYDKNGDGIKKAFEYIDYHIPPLPHHLLNSLTLKIIQKLVSHLKKYTSPIHVALQGRIENIEPIKYHGQLSNMAALYQIPKIKALATEIKKYDGVELEAEKSEKTITFKLSDPHNMLSDITKLKTNYNQEKYRYISLLNQPKCAGWGKLKITADRLLSQINKVYSCPSNFNPTYVTVYHDSQSQPYALFLYLVTHLSRNGIFAETKKNMRTLKRTYSSYDLKIYRSNKFCEKVPNTELEHPHTPFLTESITTPPSPKSPKFSYTYPGKIHNTTTPLLQLIQEGIKAAEIEKDTPPKEVYPPEMRDIDAKILEIQTILLKTYQEHIFHVNSESYLTACQKNLVKFIQSFVLPEKDALNLLGATQPVYLQLQELCTQWLWHTTEKMALQRPVYQARNYDYSHPHVYHILLLEWRENIRLKPSQISIINCNTQLVNNQFPKRIIEAIMGAGKTTIALPLALLRAKIRPHKVSLLVLKEALFIQQGCDMAQQLLRVYGKSCYLLSFKRDDYKKENIWESIYQTLTSAQQNQIPVIITAESLACLHLSYYESIINQQNTSSISKILAILHDASIITDEFDSVYDTNPVIYAIRDPENKQENTFSNVQVENFLFAFEALVATCKDLNIPTFLEKTPLETYTNLIKPHLITKTAERILTQKIFKQSKNQEQAQKQLQKTLANGNFSADNIQTICQKIAITIYQKKRLLSSNISMARHKKMAESDSQVLKLITLMQSVHYFIHKIFPKALQLPANLSYGLNSSCTSRVIIPYSSGRPCLGSRFENPNITLALTAIQAYRDGFSASELQTVVMNILSSMHCKEGSDGNTQMVLSEPLISLINPQKYPTFYDHLEDAENNSRLLKEKTDALFETIKHTAPDEDTHQKLLLHIIKTSIIPNIIFNMCKLRHPWSSAIKGSGFSATTLNNVKFPYHETTLSRIVTGRILTTLLNIPTCKFYGPQKIQNIGSYCQSHPQTRAIVDAGELLHKPQGMHHYVQQNIEDILKHTGCETVLYFVGQQLYALCKKEKSPIQMPNSFNEKVIFDTLQIDKDKRFWIISAAYARGTDIVLKKDGEIVVLSREENDLATVLQAAGRARQLGKDQTIRFVFENDLIKNMQYALNEQSHILYKNQKDMKDNKPLSVADWWVDMVKKDEQNLKNDLFKKSHELLLTIYQHAFWRILIKLDSHGSPSAEIKSLRMQIIQTFFLTQSQSPQDRILAETRTIDTHEALQEYLNQLHGNYEKIIQTPLIKEPDSAQALKESGLALIATMYPHNHAKFEVTGNANNQCSDRDTLNEQNHEFNQEKRQEKAVETTPQSDPFEKMVLSPQKHVQGIDLSALNRNLLVNINYAQVSTQQANMQLLHTIPAILITKQTLDAHTNLPARPFIALSGDGYHAYLNQQLTIPPYLEKAKLHVVNLNNCLMDDLIFSHEDHMINLLLTMLLSGNIDWVYDIFCTQDCQGSLFEKLPQNLQERIKNAPAWKNILNIKLPPTPEIIDKINELIGNGPVMHSPSALQDFIQQAKKIHDRKLLLGHVLLKKILHAKNTPMQKFLLDLAKAHSQSTNKYHQLLHSRGLSLIIESINSYLNKYPSKTLQTIISKIKNRSTFFKTLSATAQKSSEQLLRTDRSIWSAFTWTLILFTLTFICSILASFSKIQIAPVLTLAFAVLMAMSHVRYLLQASQLQFHTKDATEKPEFRSLCNNIWTFRLFPLKQFPNSGKTPLIQKIIRPLKNISMLFLIPALCFYHVWYAKLQPIFLILPILTTLLAHLHSKYIDKRHFNDWKNNYHKQYYKKYTNPQNTYNFVLSSVFPQLYSFDSKLDKNGLKKLTQQTHPNQATFMLGLKNHLCQTKRTTETNRLLLQAMHYANTQGWRVLITPHEGINASALLEEFTHYLINTPHPSLDEKYQFLMTICQFANDNKILFSRADQEKLAKKMPLPQTLIGYYTHLLRSFLKLPAHSPVTAHNLECIIQNLKNYPKQVQPSLMIACSEYAKHYRLHLSTDQIQTTTAEHAIYAVSTLFQQTKSIYRSLRIAAQKFLPLFQPSRPPSVNLHSRTQTLESLTSKIRFKKTQPAKTFNRFTFKMKKRQNGEQNAPLAYTRKILPDILKTHAITADTSWLEAEKRVDKQKQEKAQLQLEHRNRCKPIIAFLKTCSNNQLQQSLMVIESLSSKQLDSSMAKFKEKEANWDNFKNIFGMSSATQEKYEATGSEVLLTMIHREMMLKLKDNAPNTPRQDEYILTLNAQSIHLSVAKDHNLSPNQYSLNELACIKTKNKLLDIRKTINDKLLTLRDINTLSENLTQWRRSYFQEVLDIKGKNEHTPCQTPSDLDKLLVQLKLIPHNHHIKYLSSNNLVSAPVIIKNAKHIETFKTICDYEKIPHIIGCQKDQVSITPQAFIAHFSRIKSSYLDMLDREIHLIGQFYQLSHLLRTSKQRLTITQQSEQANLEYQNTCNFLE